MDAFAMPFGFCSGSASGSMGSAPEFAGFCPGFAARQQLTPAPDSALFDAMGAGFCFGANAMHISAVPVAGAAAADATSPLLLKPSPVPQAAAPKWDLVDLDNLTAEDIAESMAPDTIVTVDAAGNFVTNAQLAAINDAQRAALRAFGVCDEEMEYDAAGFLQMHAWDESFMQHLTPATFNNDGAVTVAVQADGSCTFEPCDAPRPCTPAAAPLPLTTDPAPASPKTPTNPFSAAQQVDTAADNQMAASPLSFAATLLLSPITKAPAGGNPFTAATAAPALALVVCTPCPASLKPNPRRPRSPPQVPAASDDDAPIARRTRAQTRAQLEPIAARTRSRMTKARK